MPNNGPVQALIAVTAIQALVLACEIDMSQQILNGAGE